MTTLSGTCATCPFPETCQDFGLCQEDQGEPPAPGTDEAPDAEVRAAALIAQLDTLAEPDLRAFLAALARADPGALEVPLGQFLFELDAPREAPGQ
jgi:hypothetical protein